MKQIGSKDWLYRRTAGQIIISLFFSDAMSSGIYYFYVSNKKSASNLNGDESIKNWESIFKKSPSTL